MDKLVADGRKVTISNDGATIMRLLEIEHPAAKTLVDISMSQVRFITMSRHFSVLQVCCRNRCYAYVCNIILYMHSTHPLFLLPI